ncbi:hypothetical protein KC717_05330, partial [Candidatus Dojkabacteria bacterium]|nr:hypothetical protein [Candidatus Dojkabacteria bacterium]
MNKKTRNIIISILGMLLLTAVLGTFVALNLAPGDDTSPDVIDAADDISGLSLDEMWTLGCTENSGYEVEVLGAGMGSDEQVTNNPQTISISNIDTIEFMFAQVVVNGVAESTVPPGSVTISTPTEQQVLATPTRTDKGFIYEAKLDPGAQVIADIAGEGVFPRHTPRSLTVYVFRNTGTTNYSAGKLLMK